MTNEPSGIPGHNSSLPSRGAAKPADPKIWKAAKDFQGLFLTHLVRTMREGKIETDLFEDSAARGIYDDMFSEAIAGRMTQANAMGLTDALYRQLGGHFKAPGGAVQSAIPTLVVRRDAATAAPPSDKSDSGESQ